MDHVAQASALAALADALHTKPAQPNSARRTRKGYFERRGGIVGAADPATGDDDGDGDASKDSVVETASVPAPPILPPTAEEAWAVLRASSLVVGMHPDSATESIVDFALAWNKPFAVVPCCVCAVDFPLRRAADGSKVTSYDEFVRYLRAKDPTRIRVAQLGGFEGRTCCLYTLPPEAEEEGSGDGGVCEPCDERGEAAG